MADDSELSGQKYSPKVMFSSYIHTAFRREQRFYQNIKTCRCNNFTYIHQSQTYVLTPKMANKLDLLFTWAYSTQHRLACNRQASRHSSDIFFCWAYAFQRLCIA